LLVARCWLLLTGVSYQRPAQARGARAPCKGERPVCPLGFVPWICQSLIANCLSLTADCLLLVLALAFANHLLLIADCWCCRWLFTSPDGPILHLRGKRWMCRLSPSFSDCSNGTFHFCRSNCRWDSKIYWTASEPDSSSKQRCDCRQVCRVVRTRYFPCNAA